MKRLRMDSSQADYIRSLRSQSLEDLKLKYLGELANARRDFRDARIALDEARDGCRLIEQVLRERSQGNIVEFPVAPEVESKPAAKRKRA